VNSIQNDILTLTGGANDYFVFNVATFVNTNQQMILNGVLPSHILFNLTGTGTVLQTSGGDMLYGTFLATNGGDFQFSNLVLNGELINVGGNVQLVSGSGIPTFTSFTVPEPKYITMLAAMLVGIAILAARKKSLIR
jgi:hypothetical protein